MELPSITMVVGTSGTASASGIDQFGMPIALPTIEWSTGTPSVATVSAAGVLIALSPGQSQVVARAGDKVGRAILTVLDVPVSSVTIAPSVTTLLPGSSRQLAATVLDAHGRPLVVRAVSAGTVVVEAESAGQRGAMAIVVRDHVDESIVVTFADPLPNELIGDTLRVVAGVRSERALRGVVAEVDGTRYPLELTPTNRSGVLWVSRIDVTFQKYGPYVLTVIATDETGAIGLAAITYQRDTRIGEVGGRPPPRNK